MGETMFEEMREAGSKIPDMVEALHAAGWTTYQHHDNWYKVEELPTCRAEDNKGLSVGEAYASLTGK